MKASLIAYRSSRTEPALFVSDARWPGSSIINLKSKIVFLLLLAFALPLSAQLASDQVPRERTVPDSEQIKRELEASRYSLGPIRFHPLFGLRDFGYDNNVFATPDNPVGDWHTTVLGGTRMLLPVGRKAYVRGAAIPEYSWYRKLSDRRSFGGEYSGSFIGLFNRLTIEAGGDSIKRLAPVSSEILASAIGTRRDAFGRAELQIFQRLSLFGSAQSQEQRYSGSDTLAGLGSLAPLERNETMARGGIRYRFRSFLDFSLAAETGKTDFVTDTARDNKTTAVIFGIHYDLPRTFVNVSVGERKGKPQDLLANVYPAYSTTTGSYYAEHALASQWVVDVYGHKSVGYSLYADNPYYFDTRYGAGLTIPIGTRIGVRGFGETGSNRYPLPEAGSAVKRNDDVTTVGAGLLVRVYKKASVIVVATRDSYSSNIDVFNRSLLRFSTMLSLGGDPIR